LSRNFSLQKVGNIDWLLKNFGFDTIANSADELLIINVSRKPFKDCYDLEFEKVVESLIFKIRIPVTLGGQIRSIANARFLFEIGADKILLNSAAFTQPELVEEVACAYGSQAIMLQGDIDFSSNKHYVYNGVKYFGSGDDAIKTLLNLPAGELCLNSIDRDGTGNGFPLEGILACDFGTKPIIVSGGFGKTSHFKEVFEFPEISAAATSNLLNFVGAGLKNVRKELRESGFLLTDW